MGSVPIGDLRALGRFSGHMGHGVSSQESLVLDGERGELVRAPTKLAGKRGGGGGGAVDLKAAMALKSHSEAERRRRERINAHLATLRSLVPSTEKLDKAALLAEVISHVKELRGRTIEISKGLTIPSDVDEVKVEAEGDGMNNGSFLIKASLCCVDRPELLDELKQTIRTLKLKTVRAEITTLGGRIKNVFLMTSEGDVDRHLLMTSIHQALKSVVDRISTTPDYLPRASFSSKRQHVLPFESSSSSS